MKRQTMELGRSLLLATILALIAVAVLVHLDEALFPPLKYVSRTTGECLYFDHGRDGWGPCSSPPAYFEVVTIDSPAMARLGGRR